MNLKPISRASHLLLIAVPVLAGSALPARAHPGHPLSEEGVSHLLTSPDHLVGLVAGGVLMFAVAQFARRRLSRHLLRFGGAVALFGAVALWGLRA